jgi:hypothetical protein
MICSYRTLFLFFCKGIQYALGYPCMDCPVCGLPIQEEKLLIANYKGGKQCDLLRNVKKKKKSRTIDVNNKHKLRMNCIYNK